jgi:hypothetical protein
MTFVPYPPLDTRHKADPEGLGFARLIRYRERAGKRGRTVVAPEFLRARVDWHRAGELWIAHPYVPAWAERGKNG